MLAVAARGRRRFLAAFLGAAFALAVAYELWVPARIAWEPSELAGRPAQRAEGVVLLDQRGDTIWAARGYALYRSRAGGAFERVTLLWPRLGPAWAGFSRTFRDVFRYQELVEVMALGDSSLLAFSGGDAYRVDLARGAVERVHALRYFGPHRGRGLLPHGLTRAADGAIYYGEYPTGVLAPSETVRIWRSRDEGRRWETAHEFAPHAVRHVHAVQWDPIGQALWVATGDRDADCRIGFSRDGGATFTWIGSGNQTFRAVSLLFTPEAVSWVMDSPRVPARLVRWERATHAVSTSAVVFPSPGHYVQALGGEHGVATLAERGAALWLVGAGEPRELASWPVRPMPGWPYPAVRLLRSTSIVPGGRELLVNPLRTEMAAAAVYRIASSHLGARADRLGAKALKRFLVHPSASRIQEPKTCPF